MGMFDEITCKVPLPAKDFDDGRTFQTKDTPEQYLDQYEIRECGTLWHQEYDTEDQSDPNAEGLMRIVGMETRVNKRWVQLAEYSGKINFYDRLPRNGWVEFQAEFTNGKLVKISLVELTEL